MAPPFPITQERLDSHIDKLITAINMVKEHRLTILVGGNATGKSLVRKQLNLKLAKKYGLERNAVRQVSMQMRTELRSDFGALACMAHDDPCAPTSLATWNLIQEAIGRREFALGNPYYLVFDELEIGMSQESLAGLLLYLEEQMPVWLTDTLGVMVITHSDMVVRSLGKSGQADFISLGYDELDTDMDAWLAREIVPTDFAWLDDWSGRLYQQVCARSRGKEEP